MGHGSFAAGLIAAAPGEGVGVAGSRPRRGSWRCAGPSRAVPRPPRASRRASAPRPTRAPVSSTSGA
ncbi:hypothetical protein NKH77_28535 [Streptomyces sp. M19]